MAGITVIALRPTKKKSSSLTQRELSKKYSLSLKVIRYLEQGQCSEARFPRWAFGIPISQDVRYIAEQFAQMGARAWWWRTNGKGSKTRGLGA